MRPPELTTRFEHDHEIPLLVWRLPARVRAISSAVLGGGLGPCSWLINATVPMSYDRDDPADHLTAIAAGLRLSGPGIGLLTGVDVADVVSASDGGVQLWATVGLGAPIQAAAPTPAPAASTPAAPGPVAPTPGPVAPTPAAPKPAAPGPSAFSAQVGPDISHLSGSAEGIGDSDPPGAGTVNIVAWVPVRLSEGALVNAVATVTEAKTQAIRELGLAATGTATDAVCVLCPIDGPVAAYAGPRSTWGARLARAAYAAVRDGGAVNLARRQSWSDRISGT